MQDIEIIRLFFKRIERAIVEVQKKYGRRILAVCYHILRSVPDAQETENDTYFGLWNSIPPRQPENLEAYTLKTARNCALKKYEYNHAMKRSANLVSIEEMTEELVGNGEVPETVLVSELTVCIDEFLQNLKEEQRKVFVLRYWYFLSVKEIMRECRMSKSKVESILYRVRNRLKDVLTERGYLQ